MKELITILGYIADTVSVWFFCSVFSIYILPLIFDRVIFFLPKMIQMAKRDEVTRKGIFATIGEIALWIGVVAAVFGYLLLWRPVLFELVTVSHPAFVAWGIGTLYFIYRVTHFDRIIKRDFYYNGYMRYITPTALNAYQRFIQDLDSLYIEDLERLLSQDLPYMHRQAVLRKQRERNVQQGAPQKEK